MPHRDPETGQFLPHSTDMDSVEDVEVVTFQADVGVEASNLSGGTGFAGGDEIEFQGLELVDYDEVVDRNEELRLLAAAHRLTVYQNSTATTDGTVRAYAEISAQPVPELTSFVTIESFDDSNATGNAVRSDTIDVVGRPLIATGHAPFNSTTNSLAGGGSAGEDQYEAREFPLETAMFHPRDELFLNGGFEVWNISDAGVHLDVTGQHVYGVIEG